MKDDFIAWIKNHQNDEYQVEQVDQDVIQLNLIMLSLQFVLPILKKVQLLNLQLVSNKDETVKFYLHFELKDEVMQSNYMMKW